MWRHDFSYGETIYGTNISETDKWFSGDSYYSLTECKKGIEAELKDIKEIISKTSGMSEGYTRTTEEKSGALVITTTPKAPKQNERPGITTTRFFCLPLGSDPRPKDQLPWILWEITSDRGKTTRSIRFEPQETYLTGSACDGHQRMNTKIQGDLEEKYEKKKQILVKIYYRCFPVGVDLRGYYLE